jgi:hypothetical protein
MKSSLTTAWRKRLLVATLVFTLWGIWEVSREVPVTAVVAERTERTTRRPPAKPVVLPALPLVWPSPPVVPPVVTDLFSPPPPPAAARSASAPRVAALPTFVYKYVGHLHTGDARYIFLADAQDRVTTAKVGQAVDNDWLLKAETPTELTFRHVSTGQQQILQIGTNQ